MGFNTVAVVLNDALGTIGEDKDLGRRLVDAIRGYHDRTSGRHRAAVSARSPSGAIHVGAIQIVSQAHADWPQVVVVYGNTGWCLDDKNVPAPTIKHVADALERQGWKVTPPKKKDPAP